MADKHILISAAYAEKFERQASSLGMNNKEYIEALVQYVDKVKPDILEPENVDLAKLIKDLDKRFISFIRQQEKDYLQKILSVLEGQNQAQDEQTLYLRKSQIKLLGTALRKEVLNPAFVELHTKLMNDGE
jgi:hypothetical protein